MARPQKKSRDINLVIEEREYLLNVLREQNLHVERAANELFDSSLSSEEVKKEYCQIVIKTVDKILAAGDWDSSLFLKNVIKPIREMQVQARCLLSGKKPVEAIGGEPEPEEQPQVDVLAENEVYLYVSLFQAQGHDFAMWERQLQTLSRYLINRPIYAEEDNVKKVIRLKENSDNEAYVVLKIDKKYLQKPNAFEVERKDRYGNSLETVKPGSVTDSNILELVYSGERYHYVDGRLIKAKS